MSYPPRPPMGMGMYPPGPSYHGYPPHPGMMPMHGMMPMMRPGMPPMPPYNRPPGPRKFQSQDIPKDRPDDKTPVTTVFVGNISDKAPDTMIRQMLQRCGNVLSWKRVQGASGKLQAFGFCEYEAPEATLRCMRLLNEWQICDKKLVVKVDAKTKALLDEWKKKKGKGKFMPTKTDSAPGTEKREDEEPEEGEAKESDDEDTGTAALDEDTLREDRVAKAGLDAIMREYSADIAKAEAREAEKEEKKQERQMRYDEGPKDSTIDDMEIDDEKKDIINKEIKSFRDAHRKADKHDTEEEHRSNNRRQQREDERERREREREKDRERREREREDEERREKEKKRERSPSRKREATRSRSKSVGNQEAEIDEEEIHEQKKVERKLREKEAHYQDLLTQWESRERKKAREYEKEDEREKERKSEESKEARRLKEFLEDYDDEKDDPKYYKGSALQRRMKEREKEMEADERDRQREKEEIEEIRKKLLEEGNPDVESEIARLESEKDAHLMPRLNRSPSRSPSPVQSRHSSPARSRSRSPSNSPTPVLAPPPIDVKPGFKPIVAVAPPEPTYYAEDSQHSTSQMSYTTTPPAPITPANNESPKSHFSSIAQQASASNSPADLSGKRKKLSVVDVFNQDEDGQEGPKKRKLIPLDYEEVKTVKPISLPVTKPTTAEEKRKLIKNLIEKIPTAKDELFAYPLDWTMVDRSLMDRRIRPWVNKKIIEYIGDEEPTLSDFICQKVINHSAPHAIHSEIAMVFDDEAEVFVVKMWRLLIYETEAKKLGLVK